VHPEQVWSDKATDVAVLKITAANVQPARWGDSERVRHRHMVLAMGSPFGLSQSLTYGIISAKGRRSLKLGEGSEVFNQTFCRRTPPSTPATAADRW